MIASNALASSGKYSVPAAGVAVADLTIEGFDLVTAGAVVVGLIAGAILRSSRHVSENAGWAVIRKDWLISIMSGLANFILASITVATGKLAIPDFPVLAAAGVGLFFGHQGPDAVNWFNRRFFQHEPAKPTYAAPPPTDTPPDLERLARKLDEE